MTTKQLIELTKQLVAIPSTTDNPTALKEAVTFMTRFVGSHPDITIEGFEQNGKPSFLAYLGNVRPEKFDILLNAHLDVVPAKPDKFTVVEKDGRLYGRGVLDMKGTAIVLADVFCEMVNKVPYALGLQIVSDEEVGGYDGTALHIKDGLRSEFTIMGEYANHRNTIYNAARGLCWAEIAFRGKEAHGGHPWNGSNAIVKAGNFAAAVLERFPTPDKETWATTANISNLETPNQTYNKVPDYAVLKIDFRFTQEDPTFENKDTLKAFIASIDPDAKLVKLEVFEPAVNVAELNPFVQNLSRSMRQVTNSEPQFLGRPGGSDGRHFATVNNDVVEFGLYGGKSHTEGEYVELDSFAEYRAVMRAFLHTRLPQHAHKEAAKKPQPKALHHQLLKELISMRTVNGDFLANNQALAWISTFLLDRGMFVEQFEDEGYRSIVATTKPSNKWPTVLLSAHLDVVPGTPELFKLRTRGDKLTGRGVLDMKLAIAAYLSLVESLRDELNSYDFGIMITTDEETGGAHGTKMLVDECGYRPEVAIVPDGGDNWQLEVFAKGVHWIKLTARGQSGHAARPWEGDSAIHRLLDAIKEIRASIPADPDPEDTFLSVGTIEGGTTANQIPTHASAMIDIRYGTAEDYRQLLPRIEAICKKYGIRAKVVAGDSPTITNPEDHYVKPFMQLVDRITGKKHETSMSYGTTDGRYFNAHNIPTIVVEPPGGGRHKDNEWISKVGFDQFAIIIEEYVRQMADLSPDRKAAKRRDVARLAKHLNAAGKPAYIWYATFASGLRKENFICNIQGGRAEGSNRKLVGCRDQSLPVRDRFISLPNGLYFAGNSATWGGGLATLDVNSAPGAHTIARAYLITIEQFEDIVAQENWQADPVRLPLARAIRDGHITIQGITGKRVYDELMYCGLQDGIPMFSLTSLNRQAEHKAPSQVYTKLLCAGLSQNPALDTKTAIDYMASKPGIAGNYEKKTIIEMFEGLPESDKQTRL